jgi:hypothetical protein
MLIKTIIKSTQIFLIFFISTKNHSEVAIPKKISEIKKLFGQYCNIGQHSKIFWMFQNWYIFFFFEFEFEFGFTMIVCTFGAILKN